ncbi:MAG: hypothetical protein K2W96_24510 [Gemmataceae bacterium]|nr:hypothetical protein [Gemmataceae bacterium]
MTQQSQAEERNEQVASLLDELFAQAVDEKKADPETVAPHLDTLFTTTSRGFREVLLVILLAKLRDPAYDPATDYYACNPRALYEGPIRTALTARRIPRGLSGPLNVTKGARGITAEWAARRRPREAAEAVVAMVAHLTAATPEARREFGVFLCRRFLLAAAQVAALAVETPPESDPCLLFDLCEDVIRVAPFRGNTPQRIVGYLLEAHLRQTAAGSTVSGHLDDASATSTTSKKPGDICEWSAEGKPLRVYEVTVKRFDEQRIEEAAGSIAAWCRESVQAIDEVLVLCREEDVPEEIERSEKSGLLYGAAEHHGLRFVFADLMEWIAAALLRLSCEARLWFMEAWSAYVAEPSTALDLKERWKELRTEAASGAVSDDGTR